MLCVGQYLGAPQVLREQVGGDERRFFTSPALAATTRRASTLPERTPRIQSQRRAELSSDILGDGQTFKYLYILLYRTQPLKVTNI